VDKPLNNVRDKSGFKAKLSEFQMQKSQLIQLTSLHLNEIIRRLAMTYSLLSPKGIHGGESSLPKMRSILMMSRAEQFIA